MRATSLLRSTSRSSPAANQDGASRSKRAPDASVSLPRTPASQSATVAPERDDDGRNRRARRSGPACRLRPRPATRPARRPAPSASAARPAASWTGRPTAAAYPGAQRQPHQRVEGGPRRAGRCQGPAAHEPEPRARPCGLDCQRGRADRALWEQGHHSSPSREVGGWTVAAIVGRNAPRRSSNPFVPAISPPCPLLGGAARAMVVAVMLCWPLPRWRRKNSKSS